jgi:hypothetical protein
VIQVWVVCNWRARGIDDCYITLFFLRNLKLYEPVRFFDNAATSLLMAHPNALSRRHDARGATPSIPALIVISRAPGKSGTGDARCENRSAREIQPRLGYVVALLDAAAVALRQTIGLFATCRSEASRFRSHR